MSESLLLRPITLHDPPLSVGLLWMRDRPFAETSIFTNNVHKSETSTPPTGFEPAISAKEPPHDYNLGWSFTFIRRINHSDEKFQLFGKIVVKGS